MTAELIVLLVFLPIVIGSAISDFLHLKIRNHQVLAALILFMVVAPLLLDMQEAKFRLLAAILTFGICFALFCMRLIGGGDAKMMPVVLLFVPSTETVLFLRLFAGTLALVSLGVLFFQFAPRLRRVGWSAAREHRQVPVGVAMALSVAALTVHLCWPV
jgi:prepilin peptidase CpaA